MKHYTIPTILSVLILAFSSYVFTISEVLTVCYLSILGLSLSFDNAVVNASVLKNWDHKWREIFLVIGLPIAVFGMRFIFPVLIASFGAWMNPISASIMAFTDPGRFANAIHGASTFVAGFGGAFLLMLFFTYFLDAEKDVHWIRVLEEKMSFLGQDRDSKLISATCTIGVILLVGFAINDPILYFAFGMLGIMTFIGTRILGEKYSSGDGKIIGQGMAGFFYLEMQDASFSFDDTIGSFALTNNIFLIAIGLGLGALWVRAMTIHLVETGALTTYKYLENGAFWAIGLLGLLLTFKPMAEAPEWFTGLSSALIICLAWAQSWYENRQEPAANEV